ncbi:hypothetical protein KDD17_04925 [Sulfitobacter albidus]|uniref:Replication initiation factor domain-containing protein n=1 Tax=Sulfitobacter albidus TaxID=2829501 RepID=A0A975JF76_9RHOB|nr:hypothetical protein [Sulfitobacter albidus]QUJ77348.1 hypothetical protein KDD17_04925 [Sulfitobacter albidus]
MTVLHRGFDTLALAVKANIPNGLFDYLEAEKERADEEGREILIDYNGVKLHLKAHGGNGYRFIASGGPDGATWFFKKPNAKDEWGIRLSFGSYFMAMNGLGRAKAHVDDTLQRLGVRFGPEDISISRADFCVDVHAPDFALTPEHFVMHSAAGRRDFVTDTEMSVNGKSGRTTSVTVGASRNRQVIVYDKRAEVIAHSKSYWWNIWNHTLRSFTEGGLRNGTLHKADDPPPILTPDPDQARANRVWRVEFRAGKDLLKDTWGIRTWEQFFDRFGDLCRQSGEAVRYTDPDQTDTNRARWPNHPLWEIVCAEMNDDLTEMRSGADPNPMKEVHREQHIGMVFRNVLGCSVTIAALRGIEFDGLPAAIDQIAEDMKGQIQANPRRTEKQLREAQERYVFLAGA